MKKNAYLSWREPISIDYISEGLVFLYTKNENGFHRYVINESAMEIIRLVNGEKTKVDIIRELSSKYNEDSKTVSSYVEEFLINVLKYDIHVDSLAEPISNSISMHYSNVYPKMVSIELTNSCNLKCVHCYGEYSNKGQEYMPLRKAEKLLNDLNAIGVFSIEFTGGECLIHPSFNEILLHALSLDFKKISILTNGITITDKLISILSENKENIGIQVDLHSLNEDYMRWFTHSNVFHAVEIIKGNIKKLVQEKINLRVATIVTPGNVKEIDAIADWLHRIGVKKYAVSPSLPLGRAKKDPGNILMDEENLVKLNEIIGNIIMRYDDLSLNINNVCNSINCGSISSRIAVDAFGHVKICTLDDGRTIKLFHDLCLFETSIKDFYDQQQDVIRSIMTLQTPYANSNDCNICNNKAFCNRCLLRAFMAAKTEQQKCQWYKNIHNKSLKEALIGLS